MPRDDQKLFNAIVSADWPETIKLLAKGRLSNHLDNEHRSIIHHVVLQNKPSILKSILMLQAKTNSLGFLNYPDAYGKTPLHYAAEIHAEQCIQYLLAFGAKVDARDKTGATPLMIYAIEDLEEQHVMNDATFRRFIDFGANFFAVDKYKMTLLHYVADAPCNFSIVARYVDFIRNLEAITASVAELVNQRNRHNLSALRMAVVADQLEAVTWLLQNGASASSDRNGQWEVHHARSAAVIEKLHGAGFNLTIKDNDGRTPLMTATIAGHLSVVDYISAQTRIDLNEKDSENGYSLLHLALQCNQSDMIVPLLMYYLTRGADIKCVDNAGRKVKDLPQWQTVKDDARLVGFFAQRTTAKALMAMDTIFQPPIMK